MFYINFYFKIFTRFKFWIFNTFPSKGLTKKVIYQIKLTFSIIFVSKSNVLSYYFTLKSYYPKQ